LGVDVLSESSVDTTLGSDGVRSSREKLGNTGSVEASLGQTEGGAQTGTTSTDNDGIVLVILFAVRFLLNCNVFELRRRCRLTMIGYFSAR
jgi:hypothetical protein